jgi:hypothetical protein
LVEKDAIFAVFSTKTDAKINLSIGNCRIEQVFCALISALRVLSQVMPPFVASFAVADNLFIIYF